MTPIIVYLYMLYMLHTSYVGFDAYIIMPHLYKFVCHILFTSVELSIY